MPFTKRLFSPLFPLIALTTMVKLSEGYTYTFY